MESVSGQRNVNYCTFTHAVVFSPFPGVFSPLVRLFSQVWMQQSHSGADQNIRSENFLSKATSVRFHVN